MRFHLTVAIVTVSSAILAGTASRAIAQTVEPPAATPMAPNAVPQIPAGEAIAPASPSQPMQAMPQSDLPKLDAAPMQAEPRVSTSSTPTASIPGAAVTTMVLPKETITGIKSVGLPTPPPVMPIYFTLPIQVAVAKDSSMTSNTPISDRYTDKANWDVKAWAAAVSNCLQAKPKLMRVVGDEQVPFMLNGSEGTIMLNANDKAVCPM
jgi:hypothetical protein